MVTYCVYKHFFHSLHHWFISRKVVGWHIWRACTNICTNYKIIPKLNNGLLYGIRRYTVISFISTKKRIPSVLYKIYVLHYIRIRNMRPRGCSHLRSLKKSIVLYLRLDEEICHNKTNSYFKDYFFFSNVIIRFLKRQYQSILMNGFKWLVI